MTNKKIFIVSCSVGIIMATIGFAAFCLGLGQTKGENFVLLAVLTIANPLIRILALLDNLPGSNRISIPDSLYFFSFLISGFVWGLLIAFLSAYWVNKKKKYEAKKQETRV